MMINYEHKCQRCGGPLPPNAAKNRLYCDKCKIEVNRENNLKRYHKNKTLKYANIARTDDPDRKYCEPCIYRESHTWNFLCNYYLITGQRRGCSAGRGCNKRKFRE